MIEQFPSDRPHLGPDLARVNAIARKAAAEPCDRCRSTRYVHIVGDQPSDCDGFVRQS